MSIAARPRYWLLVARNRDQGTDVVDILAGRVIPLRLGYVPVVNRGQRDIDTSKTIASALEAERQFFENHLSYKGKAQYCGTPFLARKLNLVCLANSFIGSCFDTPLDSYATHSFDPSRHQSPHIPAISKIQCRTGFAWWSNG